MTNAMAIAEMSNLDLPLQTDHLVPPPPDVTGGVLLQVGSFSPITIAHLRLLEAARDTLRNHDIFVTGAYISPTSDTYRKPGLAAAKHRLAMCRLAVESIPWVAIDQWEASSNRFVRTHEVASRILKSLPWPARIYLVCGSDLVDAMSDPDKWPVQSVERLLSVAQLLVKARENHPVLQQQYPLLQIKHWVPPLSSSLVRDYVVKGLSVRHMVPDPVFEYIRLHQLYI